MPKQHERVETPVNTARCVIHCSLMEQLAGITERKELSDGPGLTIKMLQKKVRVLT